jgi:putative ABC transport system ATP-binding protein
VPVLVGVVVDRALATGDAGALLWSLGALAALFVVLAASYGLGYRRVFRASGRAAHALRLRLARRVLDPAGGAEEGRMPGELLSVATGDAERVGAAGTALGFGAALLAALVVPAVVLLWISLPLGLLVVLGLPPLLLGLSAPDGPWRAARGRSRPGPRRPRRSRPTSSADCAS